MITGPRIMAFLLGGAGIAACIAACEKRPAPPPPPVSDAAPAAPAMTDMSDVLEKSCLSCHSKEMLAEQRLTEAQWTKVVTKMAGWGANLEASETAPLVAWLAATYGPDAGVFTPATLEAARAPHALDAIDDGPYSGGDAERGRALYTDRCSGCHGAEARGHIGVNLVDRPFLYRADELARTIRKGRGKMPAAKVTEPELADILAHLRRLR